MEPVVLYEEVQPFSRNMAPRLINGVAILLLLGAIALLLFSPDEAFEIYVTLVSSALLFALIGFALSKARLITQVRNDGLYVRFPPLQVGYTACTFDAIHSIYIRNYNPLREFGGWGIRFGPNGRAYNVSGTAGLQIVFKNGGRLLIGTQQPEALARVLHQMGRLSVEQ